MEFEVFYEKDADLSLIRNKKVAVIGYGSQGRAQALNLSNSEVDVTVGLRSSSASKKKAEEDGLKVLPVSEAAAWADVVQVLVPDETMARVFTADIAPNLKSGDVLMVSHGFNIHFKKVDIPEGVTVLMVAPKSPGHLVRRTYEEGKGVPCLVATLDEKDEDAFKLGLSYAKAIGGTKAGVYRTTFREETETDLFGEQAVLCGGLTSLIKSGYETLVDAGYSPVMAYFECVHEIKLIVDLIYEGGLAKMRDSISNTAEYGDYVSGPAVIDSGVRERMQTVLEKIQKGVFAENWLKESNEGGAQFADMRESEKSLSIEKVGQALREKMSFADQQV